MLALCSLVDKMNQAVLLLFGNERNAAACVYLRYKNPALFAVGLVAVVWVGCPKSVDYEAVAYYLDVFWQLYDEELERFLNFVVCVVDVAYLEGMYGFIFFVLKGDSDVAGVVFCGKNEVLSLDEGGLNCVQFCHDVGKFGILVIFWGNIRPYGYRRFCCEKLGS